MITTVSIYEMYRIINEEHRNPHSVLGMHEVLNGGKEMLSVRVFAPGAKAVTVIEKKGRKKVSTNIEVYLTVPAKTVDFCRKNDYDKWRNQKTSTRKEKNYGKEKFWKTGSKRGSGSA